MTEETQDHDNARHHEKMAKKKAARDKIMAGKTIEKGLRSGSERRKVTKSCSTYLS